jgi:hypothetical protein
MVNNGEVKAGATYAEVRHAWGTRSWSVGEGGAKGSSIS